MKLTKKIEAEILKINSLFWDRYLQGDCKTVGTLFTDDYRFIGTAEGEVFHSKKAAMKFLKATIDQIAGVMSRKNIETKINTVGESVVVYEFFDGYVNVAGESKFYGSFRITTIMKRVRGKWMIAHHHGSMPDSNTEQGETLGAKKIEEENRQLRNAVRRHTKELENKNRDLEIESSLERVRARAMAMQSSSELADLIGMVHREIEELEKDRSARSFITLFDDAGNATWWMGSNEKMPLKRGYQVPDNKHKPHLESIQAWRRQEQTWIYILKGEVKKKWDNYIFTQTGFAHVPKEAKANMLATKIAYWSASFNKYGCVANGSSSPLSSQSFELLIKFSRMFEQTYTRFLDLQKAEEQARESQIQLALERVRARTMAMQHSDELQDAANLLFKQVQSLGIPVWSCGYNIWEKGEKTCTGWMSTNGALQPPFKIPLTESPTFIRFYKSRQKNEEFYVEKVEGKALAAHYQYMFSLPDFAKIGEQHLGAGFSLPSSQINHVANFAQGNLVFITGEPVPDAWDMFKRFAKVFEQTYTRFLDLKNAEALARESQIQLALERVRARTMAMQKSEELNDVATLLFQQVSQLGIKTWTTGFNVWSNDNNSYTDYITSPQGNSIDAYTIDASKFPVFVEVADARKSGVDFLVQYLEGDLLKETYKELSKFGDDGQFKKILEDGFQFPSQQYDHFVFGDKVSLMFITYEAVPEGHDIFKRFGKVFEQTYTRFLDLKKAEAQAHEAQIEAALEKVRSSSLAMHQSDELEKVVGVLFDKLVELGVPFDGALICIFDKRKRSIAIWVAARILNSPVKINLPYDEDMAKNQIFEDLWKAIENGEHLLNKPYSGKTKDDYVHYTSKHNCSKVPDGIRDDMLAAESWTVTFAAEKNSVIGFDSWSGHITSEEDFQVLKRFSKVFEQAYVRFLDLQKAESQAREAQIESAMEKIRSRSLAMHHSDELKDVVYIMFKKLKELAVVHNTVAIQLFDFKTKSSIFWPGNNLQEEPPKIMLPFDEMMMKADTCHRDLWEAMADGRIIFNKVYSREQKDLWFRYVFLHNDFIKIEAHAREFIIQAENHTVCFIPEKKSALFVDSFDGSLYTEADLDVLKRAARVFEQAYTRFLDLQKAEAQAREAQVEAALERVRSRTMAMHKSEELLDVITIVCQQLLNIGINFSTVSFGKNSSSFDMDFWAAAPDLKTPIRLSAPFTKIPIYERLKEAYKEKRNLFTDTFTADETRIWYEHLIDHNPSVFSEKSRQFLTSRPAMTRTTVLSENVFLFAINHDLTTYSNEENEILIRFANVFEQAYTRFLDLQKAEAQAKEAHIEAALERVRSRTMAMQKSGDLRDVTMALYEQLTGLGFKDGTSSITIMNAPTGDMEWWMEGSRDGFSFLESYHVKYFDHPSHIEQLENWKKGIPYAVISVSGEAKKALDKVYFYETDFIRAPESTKALMMQYEKIDVSMAFMLYGALAWSPGRISDEQAKVLQRFAKVFEQTYTRFLDLQKAEAQARESQIQLALERVRARTMAMHFSNEVRDVAQTISDQLHQLGFEGSCTIALIDAGTGDMEWWMGGFNEKRFLDSYSIRNFDHPVHRAMVDGFIQQEKFRTFPVSGELKRSYDRNLFFDNGLQHVPESVKSWMLSMESAEFSLAYNKHGALHWGTLAMTEEQAGVFQRFAAVFEQTYTRFLDLQKAEAQAREAQIEAALERVRAKALAMHTPQQLKEVAHELRKQLGLLGQKDLDTCVIHLNDVSTDFIQTWAAIRPPGSEDEIQEFHLMIPKRGLMIIEETLEAYASNRQDYVLINDGAKLTQFLGFMKEALPAAFALATDAGTITPKSYWSCADFQGGSLIMVTLATPNEESRVLLRRFTNVFGLAYRRFVDLQQAEAQAREANIETALEKIRSRSLGMHRSAEILDVVGTLFEKLKELGLVFDGGAAIHLFSEGSRDATIWVASPELNAPISNNLPYDADEFEDNSIILDIWRAKETGENIINRHYSFEQKNKYFNYLFKYNDIVKLPEDVREFILNAKSYSANFIAEKNSMLGANSWTKQEFSQNDVEVLKRVARVFEQAYVRFLDLQKAEVHAHDAVRQASLDRVRAEIASMRTVRDLDRITPLIWRELTALDIPFIRCGVFIMDEKKKVIHNYLSTPEGNAIAVFHLPYDTPGFASKVLKRWQEKKMLVDHWDENGMKDFANILVTQGIFTSPDQYLSTLPKEGFYLHVLPFLQGMLYVGNLNQLKNDQLDVLQSLADAFATAYARYDDFNRLELAKQQVDNTLVELKQAQQQLVQSEKMASLGELTAGIAHEIQNPLNFVNNFSEVSKELLDEVKEALTKNNTSEVETLIADVVQNLEKINFHGQRADAIVKSMLQHSRKGSGQKELTDLNALSDEYVRLAYHGFRAKDKSFNAKFELKLDSSVPKVKVLPQDIGRVLLNLINNSFYAISEKSKQKTEGYEPLLTLITNKLNDVIEIRIRDNGNGIPESIKEKIFQPFFTTKPTGQGTGLGLSLSYDIVKAHGGSMECNSKEGEGSEFIIVLPVGVG